MATRTPSPLLVAFHVVTSFLYLDTTATYFNQARLLEVLASFSKKRDSIPPNPCSASAGGNAPTGQGPITIKRGQLVESLVEAREVPLLQAKLETLKQQLAQAQEQEAYALDYEERLVRYRRGLEYEWLSTNRQVEEYPNVLRRFRIRHMEEMTCLWEIADWAQQEQNAMMAENEKLSNRVKKMKTKHEKWMKEHDVEDLRSQNLALEQTCAEARKKVLDQKRRLVAMEQSHSGFVKQHEESMYYLSLREGRLRHQASLVKVECLGIERANFVKDAQVTSLKADLTRLQQDLVPGQQVREIEAKCRRCGALLRLLAKLFVLEVICGLCAYLAWGVWSGGLPGFSSEFARIY